jgi:hypothetical protein
MALDIAINASFKVDTTLYVANMSLPTSTPTAAAPFLFFVTSAPVATPTTVTTLLTVAVGATNEVYVAVAPPTDLITAAVGDIVQSLNVVVEEGTYDPATKTFTTT